MFHDFTFILNLNFFVATLITHLFSPSRGIFVISPVLVLSVFGFVYLFRNPGIKRQEKWLIYSLTFAAFLMLFQYSVYKIWWGGHSLGNRLMTDILVPFVFLINYSLVFSKELIKGKITKIIAFSIFGILIIYSITIQFLFSSLENARLWSPSPVDIDLYPYKVWNISDNQIGRALQVFFVSEKMAKVEKKSYLFNISAKVNQIEANPYGLGPVELNPWARLKLTDEKNNYSKSDLSFHPDKLAYFKASIENTGQEVLFGSASSLPRGETKVRIKLYDDFKLINEYTVGIADGVIDPHQKSFATFIFKTPPKKGQYKLVFDFILNGIGEFLPGNNHSYTIDFNVY